MSSLSLRRLRSRQALFLVSLVVVISVVGAVTATSSARQTGATISVMYSETYLFDSKNQADVYWNHVKKEFEAKNPGVTLKLLPVQGTDTDEMSKAALLFRSGPAPDVISLPTSYFGQFAGSNYLLPLDSYVKSWTPYGEFPSQVKTMGTLSGHVYALNSGYNTAGIYYNKVMFRQAGLPASWHPRTWSDILAAAQKIHQRLPKVSAVWLISGVQSGFFGFSQGVGNLIVASQTPTMFDAKTKKWVVDSPGLRATFNFYRSVYSGHLGPSQSALLSPNAVTAPPDLFRKGQLAICVGCANWYPGAWTFKFAAPWPKAAATIGVSALPTSLGQSPYGGTTLAGWDAAISRTSKSPGLAWKLLTLLEEKQNSLDLNNWSGMVPPSQNVAASPGFTKFAPPQGAFNAFVKYGQVLPTDPNFPVYARAINYATGSITQNPSISVDSVIKTLTQQVSSQIGSDKVEVLH